MKWKLDDDGSYDKVAIVEDGLRPGKSLPWVIAFVLSPAEAFATPTDEDRQEMLATARAIVELHNHSWEVPTPADEIKASREALREAE